MNEPSQPIEELVYDENLNEVVDIGSVVEEIEVEGFHLSTLIFPGYFKVFSSRVCLT